MLHIWYVTFSSQACWASTLAIMCANLRNQLPTNIFSSLFSFGSLLPDDRLREQGLAKDESLRRPFEALFNDQSGALDAGATHDPSFMLASQLVHV